MRFVAIVILILTAAMVSAEDLAVTVYNSNVGVVSEIRPMEFQSGTHQIQFRDVPAQIDPASVRFELVDHPGQVAILEQNYAYDLVSPEKLYNRYLDQQIELIDKDGRLYAGRLLAYSSGLVTLQDVSGRIKLIRLDNIAEINFPSLPEGLITRPTLFWLYNSQTSGKLKAQVGYQTSGMDWSAEYVGVLSSDEGKLGMSGWASITNQSGKTYNDAKLKLVAGDINRVYDNSPRRMAKGIVMEAMASPSFEEKAFFEYHLYTLPRTATIADREIKQVSLFDPAETKVEKLFTYRPDQDPSKVDVSLKFINSEQSGLGMPLPAGRVRVFKADDDGSLIMLGEESISHTPRDEEVNLSIGNAFDVVGEQRVMAEDRISRQVTDRTFEIEIRNRKNTDITVRIEKLMYGDWEVLSCNAQYERKDASRLHINLPIAAGQGTTVTLKVRYTNL